MGNSPTQRYGRRTVLAFLLYGTAGCAVANAPERSSRPLLKPADAAKLAAPGAQRLIAEANLGGKTSFVVADARTGEILEAENPLTAHPPASVTKAVTALYALEKLGANAGYTTRIVATGPIQNGVLRGDLVLAGGGDPTLDTDALVDMAKQLKASGVTKITGKLKVYGGALPYVARIDKEQPDHVGYNPAVSGLNLNFNRVYLEWKRNGGGYSTTMDARSDTLRPRVGFVSTGVAERDLPIFTFSQSNGRERWSVARRALGNGGGRWLPVRNPAIYAGDVLQTVARSEGITLPFPEVARSAPSGATVALHGSRDMQRLCRDMLKFSTNLTAEIVGMTASGAGGLPASARDMSSWARAKFGVNKARFVDHSGLGDRSEVSAVEMVRMLTQNGSEARLRPILKEIAVRGADNKVVQNGPYQIVAKTGTLNFVSALAGYIRTPDGRDLAFAIFSSDVPRRRALSKSERESPRGSRSFNGRAKKLQQGLMRRWAAVHDA